MYVLLGQEGSGQQTVKAFVSRRGGGHQELVCWECHPGPMEAQSLPLVCCASRSQAADRRSVKWKWGQPVSWEAAPARCGAAPGTTANKAAQWKVLPTAHLLHAVVLKKPGRVHLKPVSAGATCTWQGLKGVLGSAYKSGAAKKRSSSHQRMPVKAAAAAAAAAVASWSSHVHSPQYCFLKSVACCHITLKSQRPKVLYLCADHVEICGPSMANLNVIADFRQLRLRIGLQELQGQRQPQEGKPASPHSARWLIVPAWAGALLPTQIKI